MKLLLDSCVWGGAVAELAALGHEVDWSGHWPRDPGDIEILSRAHAENRVLVTLDKDFGELAIAQGLPHAGIVRLVGFAATRQAKVCAHVIDLYREELSAGGILTVDPGRIRIRAAG